MKTIAYHCTPTSNLGAILQQGIHPKIGPRSQALGEATNAVYLFPTLEHVEAALMSWLGENFEEDEEIIVLEVDISGMQTSSDVEYEIKIEQAIDSNRIIGCLRRSPTRSAARA